MTVMAGEMPSSTADAAPDGFGSTIGFRDERTVAVAQRDTLRAEGRCTRLQLRDLQRDMYKWTWRSRGT